MSWLKKHKRELLLGAGLLGLGATGFGLAGMGPMAGLLGGGVAGGAGAAGTLPGGLSAGAALGEGLGATAGGTGVVNGGGLLSGFGNLEKGMKGFQMAGNLLGQGERGEQSPPPMPRPQVQLADMSNDELRKRLMKLYGGTA
jgi:hypothetical protein